MRYLLAFLLGAHGIAHLVGFVATWRLASLPELPYKTTILGGAIDVGDAGAHAVGLLWLAAAAAFIVSGAGVATDTSWALRATTFAVVASLALCAVGWPDARIGLYVNAGLLLLLVIGPALGLDRSIGAH